MRQHIRVGDDHHLDPGELLAQQLSAELHRRRRADGQQQQRRQARHELGVVPGQHAAEDVLGPVGGLQPPHHGLVVAAAGHKRVHLARHLVDVGVMHAVAAAVRLEEDLLLQAVTAYGWLLLLMRASSGTGSEVVVRVRRGAGRAVVGAAGGAAVA